MLVIWEFERSHSGNGWVNRGKPVLRQTASHSWKVKLQDWKWVEHAGRNHATKILTQRHAGKIVTKKKVDKNMLNKGTSGKKY